MGVDVHYQGLSTCHSFESCEKQNTGCGSLKPYVLYSIRLVMLHVDDRVTKALLDCFLSHLLE